MPDVGQEVLEMRRERPCPGQQNVQREKEDQPPARQRTGTQPEGRRRQGRRSSHQDWTPKRPETNWRWTPPTLLQNRFPQRRRPLDQEKADSELPRGGRGLGRLCIRVRIRGVRGEPAGRQQAGAQASPHDSQAHPHRGRKVPDQGAMDHGHGGNKNAPVRKNTSGRSWTTTRT